MVVEMVREELVLNSFFLSFQQYCKGMLYPNNIFLCVQQGSKHISAKGE